MRYFVLCICPCVNKVNIAVVKYYLKTGECFSFWMPTVLQIQNDQCQEMDQSSDKKWLKLTNHGEWATHTVRFPVPWDDLQLVLQMHASKSDEATRHGRAQAGSLSVHSLAGSSYCRLQCFSCRSANWQWILALEVSVQCVDLISSIEGFCIIKFIIENMLFCSLYYGSVVLFHLSLKVWFCLKANLMKRNSL